MSDKKANSNASFEQEFEKFLRDDATQIGSTYRKLPQAEPDAQLDARVHALAQRALLDGREKAAYRSRPARRWVPAFASAAVLVVATGIVWRLGPHNWAGEQDGATTPKVPPSSMPTPAEPATTSSRNRSREDVTSSTGAPASAAPPAQDTRGSPEAFPAPKQKSPPPSAASADGMPRSARADDAKTSGPRSDALTATTNMSAANAPAAAREKSAVTESGFARGELKKSEAATPPASAAATPAQQPVLALEAVPEPTQNAAVPALQGAPAQMRQSAPSTVSGGNSAAVVALETKRPAPAPPVRSEESTPVPAPSQAPLSRQDAGQDLARERDEQAGRRPPAAPEVVERSLDSGKAQTSAKRAFAPSPPPPPASIQSPIGYPREPLAEAAAAPIKPAPAAVAQSPQTGAAQGFADRFKPADVPNLSIALQPTSAQLAAWPAPNCTVAEISAEHLRPRSYPPDVPPTARMRFATVKLFLDRASRAVALKAYADFRHCYPDDQWPAPLLQQLGTR